MSICAATARPPPVAGPPAKAWRLCATNGYLQRHAERARIAAADAAQAFVDVPYAPLGQILAPMVYRHSITDVLTGYALFWNLKKA